MGISQSYHGNAVKRCVYYIYIHVTYIYIYIGRYIYIYNGILMESSWDRSDILNHDPVGPGSGTKYHRYIVVDCLISWKKYGETGENHRNMLV